MLGFILTACAPNTENSVDPTDVVDLDVETNSELEPADEIEDEALNEQGLAEEGMVVSMPLANDEVESPLSIEGEARGYWFFEGSFIVRLLDADENELAFGTAVASGEWMTEDFVPFEAELTFDPGDQEEGVLVLENDNPSGLEENQRRLEIPIRFQ